MSLGQDPTWTAPALAGLLVKNSIGNESAATQAHVGTVGIWGFLVAYCRFWTLTWNLDWRGPGASISQILLFGSVSLRKWAGPVEVKFC